MRPLLKQLGTGGAICDLAASEHEGDRTTRAVCQSVDFRGVPATRPADRLVVLPLWRPALRCAAELSIKTCAGGPPAGARISKISTQTPFAAHRTNRL